MNKSLEILIDPISLVAKLKLGEGNEYIMTELRIALSNFSDTFTYSENQLNIPWYELRRGLEALARIRKREGLNIQYDEFTHQLIQDAIEDRKNLKNKHSAIIIEEFDLKNLLEKSGFNRYLKPEQIRDVISLLKLKHGANFSVPGAGKTTTILAVHTVLKQLKGISKLFVISPINAFISWEDEINEIFGKGRIKIQRLQRNHIEGLVNIDHFHVDVILVNYEKLRKDASSLANFFIKNSVHIILDESHRIKSGVNNISYNQIIKLGDLAKRRDVLSGTPMPQGFNDLESQFDFLWPGEHIIPSLDNLLDDQNRVNKINESINGLFVRTTKKELGLDEPTISYIKIPMGKIQAELYRLFKSETARILSGMSKQGINQFRRIGTSVIKLLQAATNPMLLTAKDDYGVDILPIPENQEFWELLEDFQKFEKPVKIEYIKHRVHELTKNNENKILIWSYFVRNILILEKLFAEYNPVTIYGGVPSGSDEDEYNREGRIRKFHEDPTCRIMIANPQACGEGISLHKVCHHAIYLDRNFNAAYFLQSIDRIHRLGLRKGTETKIEILICEDSIDEILIDRLNTKIINMGDVLDDPYLHSLAYDPADIPIEAELGIDTIDLELIKNHVNKKNHEK